MKKISQIIIISVLTLLFILNLTGCGSSSNAQGTTEPVRTEEPSATLQPVDELDGSQWKLISLNKSPLIPDSYISLYFMRGEFRGYAGLNTYAGEYSIDPPGALTISELFRTLLGGSEDRIKQESDYLEAFRDASFFKQADNLLEFFNDAGETTLVFERIPEYPADPADLENTRWEIISLDGQPAPEGLSAVLEFGPGGKATAQSGYYITEISYEAFGDSLRIRGSSSENRRYTEYHLPVRTPTEMEEQAARFTGAISQAANYRLSANDLEILTIYGHTLVCRRLSGSE